MLPQLCGCKVPEQKGLFDDFFALLCYELWLLFVLWGISALAVPDQVTSACSAQPWADGRALPGWLCPCPLASPAALGTASAWLPAQAAMAGGLTGAVSKGLQSLGWGCEGAFPGGCR